MGPHDRGVVMPVGAREFERELILCVKFAAAGFIAAQQGIAPRTDDEFVGWIIAAIGKNRIVLGGEDFAFIGTGAGRIERRLIGKVRETGGFLT